MSTIGKKWYDIKWSIPPDFPLESFTKMYEQGRKIEDIRQEFRLTKKQFEKVRDFLKLPKRNPIQRWRKYGSKEPYTCKICGKSLTTNIKRHVNSHSKSYNCKICGGNFGQKDHYNRHLKEVHSSHRPHICWCGKRFKRKRDLLVQHAPSHSEERPYECEICEMAFKRQGNLKDHLVIHSEERHYECEICEMTFKRKKDLNQHKQANACWFTREIIQKWERLCFKIAHVLYPRHILIKPRIYISSKNYVIPDIFIILKDKSRIIIDAKTSDKAFTDKDLFIYPEIVDKVIFWCLHGSEDHFKDNPKLSVLSNSLISLLEKHPNTDSLIEDIKTLQKTYPASYSPSIFLKR
ncbi:MAG: C2H2-type zinc finger protein [Promethearchaeota archaeon]